MIQNYQLANLNAELQQLREQLERERNANEKLDLTLERMERKINDALRLKGLAEARVKQLEQMLKEVRRVSGWIPPLILSIDEALEGNQNASL